MKNLAKSLHPNYTDKDIEALPGVVGYCSFNRLIPYLERAVGANHNEKIIGIVIEEDGIRVCLKVK